jgi:predicted pyridoxine 5'-phosphate oxidase superfamily flavin-nucleotide-binding protein
VSKHYGLIAFTDDVRAVQQQHGSNAFYDRKRVQAKALPGPDPLTDDERQYLLERDSFYLATVSATGWPYVQFRGGPPGFLRVIDDHTVGWADFRGNLQYISTGNLTGDDRVALIAMDYVHKRRLKIYGRARVVSVAEDPALIADLAEVGYDAVVERAVVVTVEAFDWNCPQHITARFTADEVETLITPLRQQLSASIAENKDLRKQLKGRE